MGSQFSRVTMKVRKDRTPDRGEVRIERFIVNSEESGMRAIQTEGDSIITVGERFWMTMAGETMAEATQRAFRKDLARQGYSVS